MFLSPPIPLLFERKHPVSVPYFPQSADIADHVRDFKMQLTPSPTVDVREAEPVKPVETVFGRRLGKLVGVVLCRRVDPGSRGQRLGLGKGPEAFWMDVISSLECSGAAMQDLLSSAEVDIGGYE